MTFLCEYRDCREAVLGHGPYCHAHTKITEPELFSTQESRGVCQSCLRPINAAYAKFEGQALCKCGGYSVKTKGARA